MSTIMNIRELWVCASVPLFAPHHKSCPRQGVGLELRTQPRIRHGQGIRETTNFVTHLEPDDYRGTMQIVQRIPSLRTTLGFGIVG